MNSLLGHATVINRALFNFTTYFTTDSATDFTTNLAPANRRTVTHTITKPHTITQPLLAWYLEHGRHHLPWQNTQQAYLIWLSEIMLQQTQVQTVIPYYQRFVERFPNATALANAEQDEVLHLWSGLGYYSRARNLHKTSQIVRDDFAGVFPQTIEEMVALPGIGRSTAGAILAFAHNQRHAILDGNVKRVLARFYEVEGWYGKKSVENRLWELAELNTPGGDAISEAGNDIAAYTQAIMDLGATVCTRSKPNCEQCPLRQNCAALANGRTKELPHRKPKTTKPTKQTTMLLIKNQAGDVLLRQNPPSGIWGGLWCPPQVDRPHTTISLPPYQLIATKQQPPLRHTFSHFHLLITPLECRIESVDGIAEANEVWYKLGAGQTIGLAAPIKKLLEQES